MKLLMMPLLRAMVVVAISCMGVDATTVDLGGSGWTVSNANRSVDIAATVPGQIHLDLERSGIIGNPFYRDNDVVQRWVAFDSWNYSRTFVVPPGPKTSMRYTLRCEGLDTVATVWLNGVFLGNSSNQFVVIEYAVTDMLNRAGQLNRVDVVFHSAPSYATAQAEAYPLRLPHAVSPSGLDNANFIRKRPSDFGWDWGPAFATVGIWKPISLIASTEAAPRILAVSCEVVLQRGTAADDPPLPAANPTRGSNVIWPPSYPMVPGIDSFLVTVSTTVQCPSLATGAVRAVVVRHMLAGHTFSTVALCGGGSTAATRRGGDGGSETVRAQHAFLVGTVDPWWPAGHGTQALYNLTTTLADNTPGVASAAALDGSSRRIGFRGVRVVTDPLPSGEEGESFYFEVNGSPHFARGASIVPFDAFESRPTDAYLKQTLLAALAANMNSVRLWGGGDYSRDSFWEMTDELGLLVWQDFQFACALYPRDFAFVASVVQEVTDQVRRLTGHPSLVLFCGSNEAVINTNRTAKGNVATMQMDAADIAVLFDQGVRQALFNVAPSTAFFASSPSNGALVDDQANGLYIHRYGYAFDPRWGDVRHYDTAGDCTDWTTYPQGRLVSEYGIQSYPSLQTLRPVTEPEDWDPNSTIMLHRQHKVVAGVAGNTFITRRIGRYFDQPSSSNLTQRFEEYIYLSQLTQAECVAKQSAYYRTLQHTPGAHTMGAFYWQLNDVWQAPTWASLEYDHNLAYPRWKLLHYRIKHAFAPLMIAAFPDGDDTAVGIRFANDQAQPLVGAKLRVETWNLSGVLLSRTDVPVTVPALGSGQLISVPLRNAVKGSARNTSVSRYTLTGRSGGGARGGGTARGVAPFVTASSDVVYPRRFHSVRLANPTISVVSASLGCGGGENESAHTTCLAVSTDVLSLWTYITSPVDGAWSQNGILLVPGEITQLQFNSLQPVTDKVGFLAGLSIRSLAASTKLAWRSTLR